MKIFQVVPYYPPHLGGMELYVQRISEELVSRGHEVTVFTSSDTPNQTITKKNGVRIYNLKTMSKIYNIPVVPSLFLQLVEAIKPDIIHAHQYPVYFSDIAAIASHVRRIPLIVHVHVISEAKSPFSGFISNMYYKSLGLGTLRNANFIIAPSLAYKTKLSKMGIKPYKIQVIPYGIDVKKFSNINKGDEFKKRHNCQYLKVILTVGRLNYQKGFQYLIKAMPGIINQMPNTKLLIVGEGEQLSYLRQLVKSLDLVDYVTFTGALSQEEIPKAYAAADVFVLPSLFESFGISLIEAQAAGKPVVATRTEGAHDAVDDGVTGLLVEPANSKQLEQAILFLLKNEALSKKMGERGTIFVRDNFEASQTVDKITMVYQTTASKIKPMLLPINSASNNEKGALKVLFITSFLGKFYGGAEVSSKLLFDELFEQGYDIKALTTRKVQGNPAIISIAQGIEIPKQFFTIGNRNLDFLLSKKIRKQLCHLKPDMIHIQDTYVLPAAIMANSQMRIPSVVTVRNSVLDETWDQMFRPPFSMMLKRRNKRIVSALKEVDHIIAVSEYIKNELTGRGIDSRKISCIYNLSPSPKSAMVPSLKRDDSVLLFAPGFLAKFKGFFILIYAMRSVIASGVNARLVISGDGPQKRRLLKLTKDLMLESHIKFTGKVDFDVLYDLYSSSDIVIFPSLYPEPLGRVSLEAMFFGKPVIASSVGGIPEIVKNGKNGLLVPPNNPTKLADAIITLTKDPEVRDRMGKEGQRLLDLNELRRETILEKHCRIYELLQTQKEHSKK